MANDRPEYNDSQIFTQAKINSMLDWKLEGPNQIVKVMNTARSPFTVDGRQVATGYVTQRKFLFGQTPQSIERLLGLRPFELRGGCKVYSFARLPKPSEVFFRFSCVFPGGWPQDDEGESRMQAAWLAFRNGKTDIVEGWPEGSVMVPQWELTEPVEVGPLLAHLKPGDVFRRANGSTKTYARYGKTIA